jgi:hypothetical protein
MNFFIKIYDHLSISLRKYKILLNNLFRFSFIKIYFIAIILINILLWLGAYYMYSRINQDIAILHYNVDFGIDLIGNKKSFFVIPLLGLIFIILDKVVLLFLLKKNDFKFLAYFLLSFLLLLHIFLALAQYSIYSINF